MEESQIAFRALTLKCQRMDYAVKLAAIEQEIEKLIGKRTSLQKKVDQVTLCDSDKIELAIIEYWLKFSRTSVGSFRTLIRIAAKEEERMSTTFTEADPDWIKSFAGVDTSYQRLSNIAIDLTIEPRSGFKNLFKEAGKAFPMENKAGRLIFVNLFLGDALLRPEFDGSFRIFPDFEISVDTNSPKRRRLNGKADYTVGFAKGFGIFENSIPRESHMVAVEVNERCSPDEMRQCIAKASFLYKSRLDAGSAMKSAWGILTDA